LWVNQAPNFGCALPLQPFKLTTAKAAKPTFWLVSATWGAELAAASVSEQADNVQIHEEPGR
jgi:hypothetical protein